MTGSNEQTTDKSRRLGVWMENACMGDRLWSRPPNGALELILNRHLGSIETGDRETDIFVIATDVILQ